MPVAVPIPDARRAPLVAIRDALLAARHVVLTTHINADGDGTGSQCAVAGWLAARGTSVHIVNPTPYPVGFLHLVEDRGWIADAGTPAGVAAIGDADTVLILDTGERSRIGRVAGDLSERTVLVLDHHLPSERGFEGLVLQDQTACATGELVYDLLNLAGLRRPWPARIRDAVYTAILTDTGGFRFSNTSPRTHTIAAELLAQGVESEAVHRRVYGNQPLGRIRLLQAALDSLEVDDALPITWMSLGRSVLTSLGTTAEDLEGIIDHARAVRGTEVALLFRETSDRSTKVSFRSTGAIDVNGVARSFGGGGHAKASGALIPGTLETVQPEVLDAVRTAVREQGAGPRSPADVE